MLYLKNSLFLYIIPTTVLAFLLSIVMSVLQIGQYVADLSKINFSDASQISVLVLIALVYFVYFIISALIGSLFTCSIYRTRKLKQSNMNTDEKTVFKNTKKYVMPNIGLGIVQFFVIFLIIACGAIPLGLFKVLNMELVGIITSVVLSLFLIVVIIGLIVKWSLSSTALIYDDKKVFESLTYSKNLVKGKFWEVFLNVIIIGGITGGISAALQLPVFLLSFILSFIPVIGSALTSAINATIFAIVVPIGVIYMTRLYLGMKENKIN